jgi:hypothetical protein
VYLVGLHIITYLFFYDESLTTIPSKWKNLRLKFPSLCRYKLYKLRQFRPLVAKSSLCSKAFYFLGWSSLVLRENTFHSVVFSSLVQIKVNLSKLATLRPLLCVLTSSVVTHSVLLCLIHQDTIPTTDQTRTQYKREESSTDKGVPRLYCQILT